MTHLTEIQFYSTPEHDCSYLSDTKAKTLFINPQDKIDQNVYTQLSELGFRRSGTHIYRPHCDNCTACISIRIPVQHFKHSKSQQRVINKNKDIQIEEVNCHFSDEYYKLYEKYINIRHKDGDMHPPSTDQFKSFLVESKQLSRFFEFRLPNGQLVAVASMDILKGSLSAVYTFYDPDFVKRSLGTFAILWQINESKKRGLNFLYLGYWVDSCQKMKYKTAFKPMELLINGKWLQAS
jgi:arginine-tRNA-protein transferase